MPYQDTQPAPAPPLKHYQRDYIPSSSVPGIGYPTSGQEVYGQVPQIPDSFPYEEMTPPPPGILERLRSGNIDPGFHVQGPASRQFDPGFHMQGPASRDIDPGFHYRPPSTTIVFEGDKGHKAMSDIVKQLEQGFSGFSPIFEALMGKKGNK